jgi:hypothetical protein
MGFQIEGGTGNGFKAGVTSNFRLKTQAVTVSDEHFANHAKGDAYQAVCNQSPTAADDCIFYLENTSGTQDMIIEGICIGVKNCTADDTFYLELNDSGTRNSGTAVTPVNVNTKSGNSASATCEKGADLDGGAATLTTGSEFFRVVFPGITDQGNKFYNFENDVILGQGKAMTVWIGGSATGTYYINVPFYFGGYFCD